MAFDTKSKKSLKLAVKLAISLVLISLLLFKIDWNSFLSLLASISLWYVALFIFLYIFSVAVSAYKWQKIAGFLSLRMTLIESFEIYITGAFINTFLPSTIGGDTYRSLALAGKKESKKDAAATVVADRISGLIATMALAVVFGLTNYVSRSNEWFSGILYLMLLALVSFFVFVLITNTNLAGKINSMMPSFFKAVFVALRSFKKPRIFFSMGFWSVIFAFAGPAAVNYVMFLALGIKMDPLDYLSVVFAASVFVSLPISVGNIGVKEWAYVMLFGMFGITSSQAVAVALLGRFLMMLVNATALPMYLKEKK